MIRTYLYLYTSIIAFVGLIQAMPKENIVNSEENIYEPMWNGEMCGPGLEVDVGRGPGSCNSDCDCLPCSPFCNSGGFCSHQDSPGRKKCSMLESEAPKLIAVAVAPLQCRYNCDCLPGEVFSAIRNECVPVYRNYDYYYDDYEY